MLGLVIVAILLLMRIVMEASMINTTRIIARITIMMLLKTRITSMTSERGSESSFHYLSVAYKTYGNNHLQQEKQSTRGLQRSFKKISLFS